MTVDTALDGLFVGLGLLFLGGAIAVVLMLLAVLGRVGWWIVWG